MYMYLQKRKKVTEICFQIIMSPVAAVYVTNWGKWKKSEIMAENNNDSLYL